MAEPIKVVHPTVEERRARGKAAREAAPQSSHARWKPADDRPDPVALLEEQNPRREPDLVPVRHGRMMVSPFTFYRGAARIMAADLKDTPRAGLTVQLCGDAHLSNFGVFASPERALLFDLNDFDETLPGPFEYDVERLAASFTIAARNNGFSKQDVRAATLTVVNAYRMAMADFAQMGVMDIYYSKLTDEELMTMLRHAAAKADAAAKAKTSGKKKAEKAGKQTAASADRRLKLVEKGEVKARTRDSLQALSKLGELVDGEYRIVSQPPIVIPSRELYATYGMSSDELWTRHPPGVPGLSRHPAIRPPSPA